MDFLPDFHIIVTCFMKMFGLQDGYLFRKDFLCGSYDKKCPFFTYLCFYLYSYFAKTHFSYIHSKMLLIPNAKMQFSVQTRKTCQKKVDVQPVLLDQMTTPSGWQDFYFCASLLERYFKVFEDTFRSDSNGFKLCLVQPKNGTSKCTTRRCCHQKLCHIYLDWQHL